MDRTTNFYSQPSYARGGAMPIYSGSRRQRGGGILGALKNTLLPILFKSGAKNAFGLAKEVVGDVVRGGNVKESLKRRGINRAINFGKEVFDSTLGPNNSSGKVRKRKPPAKAPVKAKQSAKRRRANF